MSQIPQIRREGTRTKKMKKDNGYRLEANEDAKEMIKNFAESIIEQIIDKGEASDDLYNDYDNGDRYHHETHVDKDYDLQEAADLLDDLSDYEQRSLMEMQLWGSGKT